MRHCIYVQIMCNPAFSEKKLIPVLRKLKMKRNPYNAQVALVNQEAREMLWLPTERSHIDEFRVYIMDSEGKIPTLESCMLNCSLLFSKFQKS